MLRTLSTLCVGGLLVSALAGCTNGDGSVEPSPSRSSQGSAGSPTSSPDPSRSTSGSALRDPLLELAEGRRGTQVQGQTPLLSQQGSTRGQYTLSQRGAATDAILTVSCLGPGRYTVRGDGEILLDSACTGHAAANIRLPLTRMGSRIDITAPSAFWVVVVPAV